MYKLVQDLWVFRETHSARFRGRENTTYSATLSKVLCLLDIDANEVTLVLINWKINRINNTVINILK